MKLYNFKINQWAVALFAGVLLCFSSCKIEELPDPNNPSLGVISEDASLSEIQNLVDGINSGMRNRLGTYLDGVGVVGREYYRVSNSDPRFTSDLLGKNNAVLDNNTFYTTNPFSSRYRVVKNANILIEAINNTTIDISEDSKATAIGFAKTIKAYQLLLVLNQQYTNGVRVDVADPDNLGVFLDFNGSLDAIASLLDEGNTDLTRGGGFPFTLLSDNWLVSPDFKEEPELPSPAHFALFNRAIAARVDLYRGDWAGTLDALGDSFFDINGDFDLGAYHPFSTGGGDQLNPMWFPPNAAGEYRVAHPSYITDIRMDDARIAKFAHRVEDNDAGGIDTLTAFSDDLSSDYDVNIYANNTVSMPMITNEELIIIFAEASAQMGATADAVAGIEKIMTEAADITGAYAGGTTKDELIDEILYQRKYSLYGQGHRWVDMRRYDKLADLPIDRAGDDVWSEFPRPANEN